MSATYTVAETREQLAAIIDAVEAGAEVEITRRGKPVAVVLAPAALQALRAESAGGFDSLYDAFLRTSDIGRNGVTTEVFVSAREMPAMPASRR